MFEKYAYILTFPLFLTLDMPDHDITIHTSIRILYIGIRSRYKTVPHPATRLQNDLDLDWYTRPDPSLPNLIDLNYLLFSGLWFKRSPPDHTLSLANTWHTRGTVHCTSNPRVNSTPCQLCPGYFGPLVSCCIFGCSACIFGWGSTLFFSCRYSGCWCVEIPSVEYECIMAVFTISLGQSKFRLFL